MAAAASNVYAPRLNSQYKLLKTIDEAERNLSTTQVRQALLTKRYWQSAAAAVTDRLPVPKQSSSLLRSRYEYGGYAPAMILGFLVGAAYLLPFYLLIQVGCINQNPSTLLLLLTPCSQTPAYWPLQYPGAMLQYSLPAVYLAVCFCSSCLSLLLPHESYSIRSAINQNTRTAITNT